MQKAAGALLTFGSQIFTHARGLFFQHKRVLNKKFGKRKGDWSWELLLSLVALIWTYLLHCHLGMLLSNSMEGLSEPATFKPLPLFPWLLCSANMGRISFSSTPLPGVVFPSDEVSPALCLIHSKSSICCLIWVLFLQYNSMFHWKSWWIDIPWGTVLFVVQILVLALLIIL